LATQNNPFERLRFTGRDQEASINWYKNKITDLGKQNYSPTALMNNDALMTRRLMPGQLYLFYYDPKFKESLPYYDTFPLVYPYSRIEGGFMGYNLHYLPPILRFKVMGTLLNIQQSGTSEEKRLAYSYGVLNARDLQKYYEPCIRRYLSSHVRSNFLRIPAEDWLSAAVLPTERFVKASSAKVWKETLEKV
jgi:hypothetical protein